MHQRINFFSHPYRTHEVGALELLVSPKSFSQMAAFRSTSTQEPPTFQHLPDYPCWRLPLIRSSFPLHKQASAGCVREGNSKHTDRVIERVSAACMLQSESWWDRSIHTSPWPPTDPRGSTAAVCLKSPLMISCFIRGLFLTILFCGIIWTVRCFSNTQSNSIAAEQSR